MTSGSANEVSYLEIIRQVSECRLVVDPSTARAPEQWLRVVVVQRVVGPILVLVVGVRRWGDRIVGHGG